MKNILMVMAVLLSSSVALANEKLEKAIGLCQAEVQYFSLTTGKVKKVVFPNEFHLKDMPNSFFIEYRDDLKAGAYLKWGKIQAIDVRCHIQKGSLSAFYVKINGKQIDTLNSISKKMEYVKRENTYLRPVADEDQGKTKSTQNSKQSAADQENAQSHPIANIAYVKEGKFYIPAGMLGNYINDLGGKEFYLNRKNGTSAAWPNDIENLCRDYVLYKKQIEEYSQNGEKNHLTQLQGEFEGTNQWLNQYHDDDVQAMFVYLNQ
jgi:hypothetical protein